MGNRMKESRSSENTFDDIDQREHKELIAVIVDNGVRAALLNRVLPESHKAFGVMSSICGARFKGMVFIFDFSLIEYQSVVYRKKLIDALQESWLCRLMPGKVDKVADDIVEISIELGATR